MKLIIIMPGINLSCIMFSHCFVAVLYNKIHWELEMHVGENFFFNASVDKVA